MQLKFILKKLTLLILAWSFAWGISAAPINQNELQLQLKSSEIQLGRLSQQMSILNDELLKEQGKLEKLKEEQKPFLTQLAHQQKALSQQLKLIYLLGHIQSLKTFLNPDDLNTINRHLFYYHYLNDTRLHLVDEIKTILHTISNNMAIISDHEIKLKALLQEKQHQQEQQQHFQTQRQKIVDELHLSLRNKQQQLAVSTANQRMLQNTLSSLHPQTFTFNHRTFDQLYGKLQWPIRGSVIANFGSWVSHQRLPGVIIKAPEGTPVHAISGGKVVFASWLRGFGLLVILNHGNGYMSLYARNHALLAKVGDKVKPRDVIATIGNSGGYNKPSLYFEIRKNGAPTNPRMWCR